MQKLPSTDSETLIEMGYHPAIINFAMEESTNKTLEEVLDLLLFRESYYQKLLKKKQDKGTQPKLNKKYSVEVPNNQKEVAISNNNKKEEEKRVDFYDSEDDWLDEDVIDNEAPVAVTKLAFGQNPKNIMVGRNKENKNKEKDKEKPNPVKIDENNRELMLFLHAKALQYLSDLTKDFIRFNSKDPNEYLIKLDGCLDDFRHKTTDVNAFVMMKFIEKQERFPEVLEFKNQVYAFLSKILTMNIKKKFIVDVKMLEKLLLLSFDMVLVSPKQMNKILAFYSSFCNKLMIPEETFLVLKLTEHYKKALQKDPKSHALNNQEENKENKENKENIPEEQDSENEAYNDKNDEDNEREINEEENLQERPLMINHEGLVGKEDCIVCMEKTREVVFLPCSHFLTCPLCSPRIIKCPMCNKRIEKHLKIHWS